MPHRRRALRSSISTRRQIRAAAFSLPTIPLIYAAFNVAPIGAPRPNITELLLNDPDNLLITMGLEMPENLAGKMVIEAGGANVYAISDSGFIILPVGVINQSPLAVPQARSVLLTNDICGVFKAAAGRCYAGQRGQRQVHRVTSQPRPLPPPSPSHPAGPGSPRKLSRHPPIRQQLR